MMTFIYIYCLLLWLAGEYRQDRKEKKEIGL